MVVATQCLAQIEKGNYILGGTAQYARMTDGAHYRSSWILLNPMYGKFISKHQLVGGMGAVSGVFWGRHSSVNFSAGPQYRYYFDNMLYVGIHDVVGFSSRHWPKPDVNSTYLRLGYAYFLSNSVALEPYLYAGVSTTRFFSKYAYELYDYGVYFSVNVYLEPKGKSELKDRKPLPELNKKGLRN
jgi:hypothetical protein